MKSIKNPCHALHCHLVPGNRSTMCYLRFFFLIIYDSGVSQGWEEFLPSVYHRWSLRFVNHICTGHGQSRAITPQGLQALPAWHFLGSLKKSSLSAKWMPRERGSLTGSGVLHKQVNHVAQGGSPLGDGWKLPQDGFLNHLITWQAVQSQIVLLLEKIFSTWCETWNMNTRTRKIRL